MAQRKPEDKVTVDQLLQLVNKLSSDDRQELYRRLDQKSWARNGVRCVQKLMFKARTSVSYSESFDMADV